MSDKTEEATPRRLAKAREEGDSGISSYGAQALAFLATVALLPWAASAAASRTAADIEATIARVAASRPSSVAGASAGSATDAALAVSPTSLALTFLALTLPVLAATAFAAALALVVQSGGVIATKRLAPKPERLDPVAGIAGLFQASRLFTVVRALAAGVLVSVFAYREIRASLPDIARAASGAHAVLALSGRVAFALVKDAAALGIVLGAMDLGITRMSWRKKLRMSKDEIKREHKESDGNPETKAARERARHEMLAEATVGNVKRAQVVIVNPTHVACALRYDEATADEDGDGAPVVIAVGEGDLAVRIRKAAEDYGVPIVRDVPLARALRELEVGDAIPEVLYEAVAEILH
ncbi:EscU/YscU/HrcU family type III secretion system export apparatus switch protein, partial [bacterium]